MLNELGIHMIKLDLPFRLNHVNCFLAEGASGWTVIDTGLHNAKTAARWEQELAGKEVTDILITHYHPDHFGYAGGLQAKTGAKLTMSEIDADAGLNAWKESTIRSIRAGYKAAGIPVSLADSMEENTQAFIPRVTPYPRFDRYFREGEKVQIGKLEYEVIFTPGHADGLIVFFNEEKSVLLSTDHILPKITPNISHWFHGNPDPLASFLDSLKKIEKLDVGFVIPSHGKPFYGANERISEIKKHHAERLEQTMDALQEAGTVYEMCEKLFSKKLTVHELRFAVGETLAHLEYLRRRGNCLREESRGQWIYSAVR